MNIYEANSVARWYMAQYMKEKQAQYEKNFPEANFQFPIPSFHCVSLEQCVELIERVSGMKIKLGAAGPALTMCSAEVYHGYLVEFARDYALRNGMTNDWEREYVNGAAKTRYVVASACRYGDYFMAVGARHFSPAMGSQLDRVREEKLLEMDNLGKAEQGFIDQFDVFMTRKEAWKVAVASGQLNLRRYAGSNIGSLHSEDLW